MPGGAGSGTGRKLVFLLRVGASPSGSAPERCEREGFWQSSAEAIRVAWRFPLGGSPTWTRDKIPRALHTDRFTVAPKRGGKSIPMVDVKVRQSPRAAARALPNALVEPDGPLRPLLRTPTPRCSGPREPGVAAASTARRGRFERPRRALAPARLPRPPSSEGRVGELHAHRDGVCAPPPPERHRGAARAPPECAGVGAGEGL